MTVDTCESWTLETMGEHPFHAHAGKFYVTAMNNTAVEEIIWRDTFTIDASMGPVEIKVCFDRIQPCDILLVHCHVVSHLDIGMFTKLLAVDENGMCVDEGSNTEPPKGSPITTGTPTTAPSSESGALMWKPMSAVMSIFAVVLLCMM